MKHTLKNTSPTVRVLSVTLDAEDLTPLKQKTLARLAQKLKVPGFRPGKVPVGIAEKQIDSQALNSEMLEDAVNAAALKAMELADVMPLDRPKVDVTKFVPGQELEFTATFEVVPPVKLGDYKKLKVTKVKIEITPADINDVIERMRRGQATKQDVARAAKDGDELLIDFMGTDKDGNPVAGGAGTDYPLVLGSKTFIPGFETGLVGKKAGDNVDLKLSFPKDYHAAQLAGAKVNFAVTVKAVKEVVLPKLDAAFAAASGPFKTMAELKADVTRELTAQKEREAEDKLKDSLVEQLVKASKIPAPEVLVNDQMASLERDFAQNLMYRGLTLDQYLEDAKLTKEEWQTKELRAAAERRVQVGLALSELSKAEKIDVTQEEMEARLQELFNYYKDPNMRKQLDTPEARRDIANRVLTEKTVERLVVLNLPKGK